MWLDSSGREMTDTGWAAPEARSLGVLLAGDAIDEVDERGRRVSGDTLLVLYNAAPAPVTFVLPADGAQGGPGTTRRGKACSRRKTRTAPPLLRRRRPVSARGPRGRRFQNGCRSTRMSAVLTLAPCGFYWFSLRRWHMPLSTRLQLHGGFPFPAARSVVPYLAGLGVTDCYLSPIFAATPGSTHGYDVTDHNRINDELGGADEYERLSAAIAGAGMGQLLDIVPNHMGVDAATNPGGATCSRADAAQSARDSSTSTGPPSKPSCTAGCCCRSWGIDATWCSSAASSASRTARSRLRVALRRSPAPQPKQFPIVLRHGLDGLKTELGDDPALGEFLSILSALGNMPGSDDASPEAVAERRREQDIARERLSRVVDASERLRRHVDEAIAAVNGEAGRPSSFDALHELLEAQSCPAGMLERRPTKSATGGSSTSTIWRRCGSRIRRCSRPQSSTVRAAPARSGEGRPRRPS